jgi:hypothetical protein
VAAAAPEPRQAPAAPEERELLEVLLAEPELVATARAQLAVDAVEHPGLRRLLEGLYALDAAGEPATLDQLRPHLGNVRLAVKALELQEVGRHNPDRAVWLGRILERFRERRLRPATQELHNQLQAARDHGAALELLRQLQNRNVELGPDTAPVAGVRS